MSGVIPVLPVVDSIVTQAQEFGTGYLDREHLRRVQTPQGFRYEDILGAHRSWTGSPDAGDDAQVLQAAGQRVALVAGDEALAKVTFARDFQMTTPSIRTGMGFDVHRLVENEELWLAGVLVPYDKGLSGHSDADVGLHALVDALLGAIGAGDIGIHFPPIDSQWKGASSSKFVEHARELVANQGLSHRQCRYHPYLRSPENWTIPPADAGQGRSIAGDRQRLRQYQGNHDRGTWLDGAWRRHRRAGHCDARESWVVPPECLTKACCLKTHRRPGKARHRSEPCDRTHDNGCGKLHRRPRLCSV